MKIDFYIESEHVNNVQEFIKTLKSARHNHNPFKVGNKWNFNLTLEVTDGNQLSKYLDSLIYKEIDKEPVKKSFLNRLLKK